MTLTVVRPCRRDTEQIFHLVNAAFKMEVGTDGVAYRTTDRFTLRDTVRKSLDDMLVLKDNKTIYGCVQYMNQRCVMEISLIAVHPDHQGKGHGSKLMRAVEKRSRMDICTVSLPSCRTDVIPFFEKMGYKFLVSKSITDMQKLYPIELGEKSLSRQDIEWVIMAKKRGEDEEEENE